MLVKYCLGYSISTAPRNITENDITLRLSTTVTSLPLVTLHIKLNSYLNFLNANSTFILTQGMQQHK